MSYNGSGTFVINTAGQPVVSGTVISSTAFNALTADLATGLSTAITKDGQTTPTANIPMGNNKITGLAVGTAATDAATLSQVQSTAAKLIGSVSGADTITGTLSPTLGAYAAGQMFYFVAAGDNTTAVTLNINSLGAKDVTRDGSVALAAGDIKSGEVVVVVYDGTRFQVVSQLNSAGNATFANVSITSALNVGGVATFSGGTANGVLYLNGSKAATSGSALVFDGTNLGIGTSSPSAFAKATFSITNNNAYSANSTVWRTIDIANISSTSGAASGISGVVNGQAVGGVAFVRNGTASDSGSTVLLYGNGSGFAEGARITSDGNLGVGTTSPTGRIHAVSAAGNDSAIFSDGVNYTLAVRRAGASGQVGMLTGTAGSSLAFGTDNTERARITSGGALLVGATTLAGTGSFQVDHSIGGQNIANFRNTASSDPFGPVINFPNATPDNTNNYFLLCVDSTNNKCIIYSNGTISNRTGTYNAISDIKLKQDVVDAASQWDDIKNIRVRKFRLKDEVAADPNYPYYIGLVAQEAELVSPGLVDDCPDFETVETTDEEGNVKQERKRTGTVTKSVKYSILYMKAVKALQEAMARIEKLEAEVAAMKGA